MWRRLNRLEATRPLVWINEVCWEEMGEDAHATVLSRTRRTGTEGFPLT